MRIGFVVTGGFDRSGRERVIPSLLWLVERLARSHDVFVYVLRYHRTPCRYQLRGATICDLGRPEGWIRQAAALWRSLRADGPFDVLHAYWAQPAGRIAAPLGRLLRTPTVVTMDSGEFVSLPGAGYGLQASFRNRMGVRIACRAATRVTVCSRFQARLAAQHGVEADIVPLGVDTALFTPRPDSSNRGAFRLLHVASLNPVKDQATLLHAVQQLVSRGRDVTLDIAGEDTMDGRLQDMARAMGLDRRVAFHGFLPSDELVRLYHTADLFVLTSLHEAAGVVLLEAAACELPVAGSAVGYLADWAPDAATTVRPGDADALADAIASLADDAPGRTRMAAAGRAWAQAHDAAWTAQRFESLYRDLTRRRT
jgi:glycosyltransferase involved in cell wall biosynthesis